MMKKLILLLLVTYNLLASNYRLIPLSSHGVALSSSNLAKSFNADAVFINPANMTFLDKSQLHFSGNYYHIKGSHFTNQYDYGDFDFYGATDAKGEKYTVALPTLAYMFKITEDSRLGLALYSDFAALYGWSGDYAKSLAKNMDIRGGTLALSFATKITPELSFGASVTANHTRLKFSLEKDNAKSINYLNPPNSTNNKPTWVDNYGNTHNSYWAYNGDAKTRSDINYGYKLALTYAPAKFDEKLRFSTVYNSQYMSKFYGTLDFNISKFEITDFYFRMLGIGSNYMANEINSALKAYGFDAFNDDFFNNIFGFNTSVAAVLLDVYNFDLNGDIISSLNSQDDKINFRGDLRTEFLYPASINFGVAYEQGKHEFMVNIGRTFWNKFKKLKVDINAPEMPIKTIQLIQTTAGLCMQEISNGGGCENSGKLQEVIKQAMQAIDFNSTDKKEMQEYMLAALLNDAIEQKWKNTTLISLGYRYNHDEKWSFMAGFATEDSPVKREEISFLAKDSRIYMYSLGTEYRYSENLTINLSGMYQKYADVKTDNSYHITSSFLPTIGEFKKQSNQIINLGFSYIF